MICGMGATGAVRFGLGLVLLAAGVGATLYVVGRTTPPPSSNGPSAPAATTAATAVPATTEPDATTPASATPDPTFPAFEVDPSYTCTLEAGTYGGRFGNVHVSATTPTTWHGLPDFFHAEDEGCGDGGGVRLEITVVSEVYPNICHWLGTGVDVRAPGAEEVAFSDAGFFNVVGPIEVELGGYPAYRFKLTLPSGLDANVCSGEVVQFWRDPARAEGFGPTIAEPGQLVVYFVEVEAVTLGVYIYKAKDSATPAMRQELNAVVDSLRFEVDAR